jgi:hypothetical protein
MKRLAIKHLDDATEQLKWLYENRKELMVQRKSILKEADSVSCISFAVNEKGERMKAEDIPQETAKIKVKVIINTTGLMDSHFDVHIPGLWKKSLYESKIFYLVNQHRFNFDGILSDDVKAYTQDMSWKELDFAEFEGETQALVFDAVLDKDSYWFESAENRKLFNLYKSGKVRNHSVGMRYIKDFMCINSDAYPEEKKNWDKYFPYVANKEYAEKMNFFFAVTEAKIIEGSAVVRGSNYATPTQEVTQIKDIDTEAESITPVPEPSNNDTQTEQQKSFINPNLL